MKKLSSLLLFIVLTHQLMAQMPKDPETGVFTYKGVIEAPGTKEQLYFRAKQWIIMRGDKFDNTYAQLNRINSIQIDDGTRMQGKFFYIDMDALDVMGGSKEGTLVWGHLIVEVKDGKMRYSFTNFHTLYQDPKTKLNSNIPLENAAFKGVIKRGAEYVPKLIEDLKIFMNRKYDEW